jgi:ABC-type enterochelin transport system permease subunit
MKNWTIGAISGGLAGIAGAWLSSEYNFSLFLIILIGAIIGFAIGVISKLMKKKK